jgi:hypothetical protein
MPRQRDDLHRHHARGFPGALEEPVRRFAVSPGRRVHVDDLPELVDRPIQVDPPSGDLDVGLVHMPAVAVSRSTQQTRLPLFNQPEFTADSASNRLAERLEDKSVTDGVVQPAWPK